MQKYMKTIYRGSHTLVCGIEERNPVLELQRNNGIKTFFAYRHASLLVWGLYIAFRGFLYCSFACSAARGDENAQLNHCIRIGEVHDISRHPRCITLVLCKDLRDIHQVLHARHRVGAKEVNKVARRKAAARYAKSHHRA